MFAQARRTLQIALLRLARPSHARAADGALRRPGGLQPRVPGHAARGRSWSTRAPTKRPTRRRRSPRPAWPAAATPTAGRATSPLPPSRADRARRRRPKTRQRRSSSCSRRSSSCWRRSGASSRALPPPDPQRDQGTPEGRARRKNGAASWSSCWPRSRSASTRRTRGRRSATSARPRARRSTRSTTTSCAARSRTAARATFPRTSGKQAVRRADDERHRRRRRPRASRPRSCAARAIAAARPARRGHRHARRRRSAASRRRCGARPTRSSITVALPLHARRDGLETTLTPADARVDSDAPWTATAVIGNPVAHSQSPLIHAALRRSRPAQALDYEPLLVPAGRLRRHACARFAAERRRAAAT